MRMKQKKTTPTIPDPETLSEEERRELLRAAGQYARRQLENEAIASELARRAQEAERESS
jgi:hypothetical protein